MSRLRQSNGDDYPEAAGKHLTDASVLVADDRHDGAAYLAGYVVECALKALIQMETGWLQEATAIYSTIIGGLRIDGAI